MCPLIDGVRIWLTPALKDFGGPQLSDLLEWT